MSGKSFVVAGLLAIGLMFASTDKASAQYVVRHGNHFHTVSPGWGYGGGYGYGGGFYRPVYSTPFYGGGFGGYPYGYTSGFGFGTPNLYRGGWGGYPYGGWGGGFNTVNFGVYRPGFGMNLGFVIR